MLHEKWTYLSKVSQTKNGEQKHEIDDGKYPSATVIESISRFGHSMAIQIAYPQIDDDCHAHNKETETQECIIHQRDIWDSWKDFAKYDLVGYCGQDTDKRNANPVAQGRFIHPEYWPG